MRDFIENIINGGEYNLEELDVKIKRLYVMGDLTETDMEELLVLAAEKANNAAQIDIFAKLVDLEHRIVALETDGYATWSAGYVTKKGEIVKIDLNNDGELDFAMYDGGRSETSLSVGKINGWYKVTSTGTKTFALQMEMIEKQSEIITTQAAVIQRQSELIVLLQNDRESDNED